MTSFAGQVVLISGVARGQGRSHAVAFAAQGATVVGVDWFVKRDSLPLPVASPEDLDTTVALVRAAGADMDAHAADVTDAAAMERVAAQAVHRHGRIDVVVANAGVGGPMGLSWEQPISGFRDVLDINLVGAWNVVRVAVPSMIERCSGSVVMITSGAAVKGLFNLAPYVAAKHGLAGLAKTMAKELAPHGVRVNVVQPGNVNTPLLVNDTMARLFLPGESDPSAELFAERASGAIPMGIPWVEPADVTEAVLWLASDKARYVTGATIAVDGGGAIP
jgi:SDR family mycofactocin-dependent oxidoreductase